MEIDTDKLLMNAIRDGLQDGIKSRFGSGYNSPLDKLLTSAIEKHSDAIKALLSDAISSCLTDSTFREQIAESTRHTLAKTLVQRFGGELEKQVNALKSDPTTRARITLAIEEIVKQKA